MTTLPKQTLRVGFVGTGFIAHFHLKSLIGVRNVEVTGVYSRNPENRARFVSEVEALDLGECRAHESLESLLSAGDVDAVWILSPNYTRLDVMRTLHREIKAGRGKIFAVACEKPLARTVAEAREMLPGRGCRSQPWLSQPGLLHTGAAGQGDHLAARRLDHRPALSRTRRGRTCRSARALVLAGRQAGRWGAFRYDVPQR